MKLRLRLLDRFFRLLLPALLCALTARASAQSTLAVTGLPADAPAAITIEDADSVTTPTPAGDITSERTVESDSQTSTEVGGDGENVEPTAILPAPSESDSTAKQLEHPRITQPEFTFAGLPRYTMTGDLPYRETHIEPVPATIFSVALVGLAATITYYQLEWYPDSTKGPFNFDANWGYSMQLDKAGHVFAGWMGAYCSHEAFIVSGLSKDDAALWGAIGGLVWQTFIEVQDGFHRNYGFDWTDQVCNVLGVGYFYAQHEYPFLQNFQLKWSFGPHERDSARNAAQIRSRIIFDDYDGQNVWLSANVHRLLPDNLKPYWPKWLQLAVGVGAKDVELIGYHPYRTLFVALDYNYSEMLPDLGSFGNWLVQGLNNFRLLPSPALQIAPEVKFYLIYPFKL